MTASGFAITVLTISVYKLSYNVHVAILWWHALKCALCLYVAVDCGALVAPENGSVTVTMTTLGGVASYTCDSSFRLIGMDSRQCPENGTWSGDAPVCESNYRITKNSVIRISKKRWSLQNLDGIFLFCSHSVSSSGGSAVWVRIL